MSDRHRRRKVLYEVGQKYKSGPKNIFFVSHVKSYLHLSKRTNESLRFPLDLIFPLFGDQVRSVVLPQPRFIYEDCHQIEHIQLFTRRFLVSGARGERFYTKEQQPIMGFCIQSLYVHLHTFKLLFFFSKCYFDPLQVSAILGQLHDDTILLQLSECFSLFFKPLRD